jgi:L-fucose isomerase-like protein
VEPDEIIGNRWPGFGLTFQEDASLFLNNATGHHYSIVFGNYVEELRHLARILGIKFVYNC